MQCFHQPLPQVVRANPDVSRISLRKEGEVAWLESPNGLGATVRVSITRRSVKNLSGSDNTATGALHFPAILCHPSLYPFGQRLSSQAFFNRAIRDRLFRHSRSPT